MAIGNYVSAEIKLLAIAEYQEGGGSLNQVAAKFGVNRSTLQKWLLNYDLYGEEGLRHRAKNHYYPEKLKQQAVESYLSGQTSIEAVCKKYQIRSRTQLEQWIFVYNGQKEFRPAGGKRKGARLAMASYEERRQAVEYCIAHGKDYVSTAAHFGLTYQQIYGWVRRYHTAGLKELGRFGCDKAGIGSSAEYKRLQANCSELEMELAVHQKLQQFRRCRVETPNFSGVRHEAAYRIIKELHEKNGWPVYKLCVSVGVSRAGYYKWRDRQASSKQLEDEKLAHLIAEIYQSQHGIPGYRQMKIILDRRYGIKCNLKRIYRLMHILGLRSVCRKKKRKSRKKAPAQYVAENILSREFTAGRQNEKWLTDITEFKYGAGEKAYLSAVLDLYGRNIVAFSLGRRNNTALVFETFDQAFQRYPDARPLVHSDRGVQYTSRSFRKKMQQIGIYQSMSRPGKCLDNAPMEGFWGILKSEMYYLRHFDDYDELCTAVSEYIDFYNNHRYQKNLGCMTPLEFIQSLHK